MESNQKENSSSLKNKVVRSRNYQERSVPKFLKKVFYILEENKYSDLISWTNEGVALVIKKPTEFAEKVLPLYFKHSNFASFIRQLNMYKFKKRKCYQYDHVYHHEMFQREKIDLLRNIQRKCSETTHLAPADLNVLNDEVNIDVDQLLQENLQYRRIHKTLSTQIQFIESKMKELKTEVSNIYTDQMQTQANENFLKKIIRALTKAFGYDSIAKVIELDVEDAKDAIDPLDINNQTPCHENSGTFVFDEESLFQLSKSSNNDDCYPENCCPENCCPGPLEYELSEQFLGDEVSQSYENFRIIYPHNSPLVRHCQLQEYNLNKIIPNHDCEHLIDSKMILKSQAYKK